MQTPIIIYEKLVISPIGPVEVTCAQFAPETYTISATVRGTKQDESTIIYTTSEESTSAKPEDHFQHIAKMIAQLMDELHEDNITYLDDSDGEEDE